MLASDCIHFGFAPSSQSHAWLGSFLSTYGLMCVGSPLLALDFSHFELAMPTHSYVQLGFASPAYGMTMMGSSPPVLDSVKPGLAPSLRTSA